MTMAIERKINKSTLDKIIDDMTNVVEKSKDDIFQINEEVLRERTQLQRELEETRMKVKRYVAYVNDLNTKVKQSKYKLSVVSKQFHVYSEEDRKSTRLNSSHVAISYAVFCLKKKSRGRFRLMIRDR